jgi:hypothetical protein
MIRNLSARTTGLSLISAFVCALALPVTPVNAQSAISTDLSSQHDPRVSATKRGQQGGGAAPRGPVGPPAGFRAPGGPPAGFRGPAGPRGPMVNPNVQVAPRFQGQRGPVGIVNPGYRGPAGIAPGYRGPIARPGVVTPGFRGPAVGFRAPYWRGGRATFIRGRHYIRRGGLVLPLVGLGALGAIYVGSRAYTPYAFVDSPDGGQCAGPTDDGVCELRMTEVPLESGGAELQCVAYCPPQ